MTLMTYVRTSSLNLPMLRLLNCPKHKDAKIFENHLNPVMLPRGINWIVLAEYSQMSSHMPGFQSSFRIFATFCID